MTLDDDNWRRLARTQRGLLTRRQLAALGVNRWAIAHRVASERWQQVASDVFATTTGDLVADQMRWAAVLHGGEDALLGGIAAACDAGLRKWDRPQIEVLIPHRLDVPSPLKGVRYRRTRRNLAHMRDRHAEIPRCRIEPAVLIFASEQRSERTAAGVLTATVQQRLATHGSLMEWLDGLAPLRRSRYLRSTLDDIAGGAQSVAEIDVKRMCKQFGLVLPERQVRRRDAHGRMRFTDCEWTVADGRVVVLEVDGAFHMEVEEWEADMTRQRALSALGRYIVRCSAGQVRDTPDLIAGDLIRHGVPQRLGGNA